MTPAVPVSVVVPTRGRAGLVEALLASLTEARASYAGDVEVILCDSSSGGDADRVRRLAAAAGARLERCGAGIAHQRNVGITAARSELVWFVDSDCRVTDTALPALVAALGTGGVAAAGTVELSGARTLSLDAACDTGIVAAFDGFGAAPGASLPWAVTANLLVRRDALGAVGGFDEAFPSAEDVDLGLRLRSAGGIRWVPDAVVHHDTRTWSDPLTLLRRFFRYGTGDAHLLASHPELRGPVEPSLVNAAPLAAAAALLATRSPRRAVLRVVAWVGAWLTVVSVTGATDAGGVHRRALAALLLECLHAGRQFRAAVVLRTWPAVWSGVVLDADQRQRERARRRQVACALAVSSPVLVVGARR